MLLLCMYMYTHNMQVPTSQHAWLYTLCHTPLVVVIAVQRAVVNSAHIHYNVTWWKCLRLSTPHNVSITVFGQLLQHIACQGLTQVGVCVCVCMCVWTYMYIHRGVQLLLWHPNWHQNTLSDKDDCFWHQKWEWGRAGLANNNAMRYTHTYLHVHKR